MSPETVSPLIDLAGLAGQRVVVKIGGSTFGSKDTTIEDIVSLWEAGVSVIIVHGGGKLITDWSTKHNISSRFVEGLRVTDGDGLQVVIAVLAGLVNKEIVAGIQRLGGQAMGISGADGGLIRAVIKDHKLGYVGDVTKVNTAPLQLVMREGYIPVIAPLGLGKDGQILNINADLAAGAIAAATYADKLIFITDVPGVCDSGGQLLPILDEKKARALIDAGVIAGGMIPKVEACFGALPQVGQAWIMDGQAPQALAESVVTGNRGTRLVLKASLPGAALRPRGAKVLRTVRHALHRNTDHLYKELTVRESEVLYLAQRGLRNNEIAQRLGMLNRTVEVHMSHILSKLGAVNRTEAIAIAVQEGLIPELKQVE